MGRREGRIEGGWEGRRKEERVEDGGGEGCNIVYMVATSLDLWLQESKRKTCNKPYYNLHDKWIFEFWLQLSVSFLQSGTLKIEIEKKMILREVC